MKQRVSVRTVRLQTVVPDLGQNSSHRSWMGVWGRNHQCYGEFHIFFYFLKTYAF